MMTRRAAARALAGTAAVALTGGARPVLAAQNSVIVGLDASLTEAHAYPDVGTAPSA